VEIPARFCYKPTVKKIAYALIAIVSLLLPLPAQEEGQSRGLEIEVVENGAKIYFSVPDKYTVHSAKEEPMDWDYALVDEKANFDFGIRAKAVKGAAKTVDELQADYLKGLHEMYDPKITSKKSLEFTLADGSKVHGFHYESDYWKYREVVIIPGKKAITIIEFHAEKPEVLKAKEEEMRIIVELVEEK
jgi:hypothetical protein